MYGCSQVELNQSLTNTLPFFVHGKLSVVLPKNLLHCKVDFKKLGNKL